MSDLWSQWEGHVVDGTYPLLRCLGTSDHSGVFLTESPAEGLAKVAVKLMPAIPSLTEAQLSHWRAAASLSHPRLMRLYDAGRCQLGERHFLFVIMEFSDQNLAEVLTHRALTPDEAREMLLPTLDALAFLHGRKLVQGQLKPSNILVIGDQLKLASDTIRPASEAAATVGTPSVYDAPETTGEIFTTAADVWALGVTLVEALTRRPPSWADAQRERVSLAADFPPAFAETVRRCLNREPAQRPDVARLSAWVQGNTGAPAPPAAAAAEATPAEIEVLLEAPAMARAAAPAQSEVATRQAATARAGAVPRPAAPAQARPATAKPAGVGARPVSASATGAAARAASPATPQRLASAGAGRAAVRDPAAVSRPTPPPPQLSRAALIAQATLESVQHGEPGWRRHIPMIIGAVALVVAVWVAIHLISSHSSSQPQSVSASSSLTPTQPADQSAATAPTAPAAAAVSAAAPATSKASKAVAPASGSSSAVHEEIPSASRGARNTIHGRVKVSVRVTVDRSGNVVNETFEDLGPSPYFARLSIQAARKWKFTSADERARQWVLHFEFSREGSTGHAVRARSR